MHTKVVMFQHTSHEYSISRIAQSVMVEKPQTYKINGKGKQQLNPLNNENLVIS